MIFFWFVTVLLSLILGVIFTLTVQYHLFVKYFIKPEIEMAESARRRFKFQPFQLPKVLADVVHCSQLMTKESCVSLNLLLQFLFHELRDTERVRLWLRNKLHLEFEELLSKSTIGKMVGNIKILEIDLGSEFPVINNITVQDAKVNDEHSHIDTLDLKLDVNYSGGFKLVLEANMLLGKAAHISIKVNELFGEGRLQFTRLPYSHWSFTFYHDPKIQLQVESHFQGRPIPQITHFISNQIKKSIKKKHTLPNYKLRYKPFFSATEDTTQARSVSPGQVQLIIHRVSRLMNEIAPENREVYCTVAADSLPWVEIVNYGNVSYYVVDVVKTKQIFQNLWLVLKQELVDEKKQVCVVIEDVTGQDDICRGDIILSIDGKKVTSVSQAQKFIKSSAVQLTVRIERKVECKKAEESSSDTVEPVPTVSSSLGGLRKRKGSESESGSSSSTLSQTSSSGNKINLKRSTSETNKSSLVPQISTIVEETDVKSKILKSKSMLNKQVILFEEYFTLQVSREDKYLNINIRAKETDNEKDKLLGYINMPLSEVQNSNDTTRCLKLKPPDSFAASNIRNHRLSSHNGFIPLLLYGDIMLTVQYYPSPDSAFRTVPEIIEPSLTPESEGLPVFLADGKKHVFRKTQIVGSACCEFCGRKIWLKDAGKCRDCNMTCHKKCVVKCKFETVCIPRTGSMESVSGGSAESGKDGFENEEELFKSSFTSDTVSSSRESTPQPTPTKKRLGNLLASVVSASRGLKRVGSANNLTLPGDQSPNSQSRSLPPSPQQSPAPSRKSSLPLELSEELEALLECFKQHPSNEDDIMDWAKESGKTIFEELDLQERKKKINEMINDIKTTINEEARVRSSLVKEEQAEKDPANKAKIAFLIGKCDEKTQLLTILMLHFCSGLQSVQDLEDAEVESRQAEQKMTSDTNTVEPKD